MDTLLHRDLLKAIVLTAVGCTGLLRATTTLAEEDLRSAVTPSQ